MSLSVAGRVNLSSRPGRAAVDEERKMKDTVDQKVAKKWQDELSSLPSFRPVPRWFVAFFSAIR